ncbi:MAG TPA: sodium-dependent transporter [Chthoniobacterales bacterium]
MSTPAKEQWSSRIGVILAVTGSAVGLGNFLRFPGLAAQYEGGIFMIPYFVSLLVIGLPLAWAEWAMGRYGGVRGFNSTPGIFRLIWKSPLAPYVGVLGLIVPVMIYMYYVFIEAWCLGYAWNYLAGSLSLGKSADAYGGFFAQYTGIAGDGSLFQSGHGSALVFLVICILINFWIIYRGLSRGIELFCLWAMPVLVILALIVLVRVLTLGTPDPAHPELNVLNGLGFMWNPQAGGTAFWKALFNAEMWLKAAGQIFFSLSVGFGVIITYASYLKKSDDVALSSTTAVAGNEFCEVSLGGMITIPAAFVFLGAAGAAGGTFALGFKTLPMVFEYMPAGRVFGFFFFFLLFLAAITSSLSMLQPAIAFLEEGLALNRKTSVIFLGFITLAGNGIVVYFSGNAAALGALDFWVGTLCIFLLATVQTILFSWVLGAEKGMEELRAGAELAIPRGFIPLIKYVSPVYLITIFIGWLITDFRKEVAGTLSSLGGIVALVFIAICFALFLLLINQAVIRWNQKANP